MRKPISQHDAKQTTEDWKSLDLVPITGELSSLLSRLSFLKMQAETTLYLIQRIQRYIEARPWYMNTDDQYELVSKIEDAQGGYHGLSAQYDYLIQRTSAQTETVYSLLASQNSLINLDIARESHKIAELSRNDNQAMRTLAELSRRDTKLMIELARDSRSVALATARDSAAMRVIAAVTILFLPATFTATFFSMSFFNFLDSASPKASPWIWIYFVITGLLTVIIQTIWALMSHRSQTKLPSSSDVDLRVIQVDGPSVESARLAF
ncbi:Mg2+ transporter -like Zinc transport protein [Rutstroemia sp. NJR-2017a WRK4]|nr:Mg2+ transporter -like Zinc transport protein [Rutstroemia sp. NJR-2017a WRK4]